MNPTTVVSGGTVALNGAGFAPIQALQVQLMTSPASALGSTQSDSSGGYSASVTMPTTVPAGSQRIILSGPGAQGATHQSIANVTVALATTGVMTNVLAGLGALLLGLGSKLVLKPSAATTGASAGETSGS